MPTRRAFLRATAGLGGTVALASAAGTVVGDHPDRQPEHVSLTYDSSTLERYRPLFVLRDLDQRPTLYGWVATSPEWETGVCAYACEYAFQDGVSPFGGPLSDSHKGDHEWFYVEFDSDTDSVVSATWTAYHWIAGRADAAALPMDDTHVKAHIVHPWHHYYTTTEIGTTLGVEDLTAVFNSWLDNGLEDDLHPGSVVNPWTMMGSDGRPHWWRDDVGGLSVNAVVWSQLYRAGLFGASDADPVI